jgi:hypothetical protein
MLFFSSENSDNGASISGPRSTSQSEFIIKNYDRLKLKWLDFSFYFFRLSAFFLISFFFLSLTL